MKANELRIGNLINGFIGMIRVEATTLFDFHSYDYKPIPLTKELLLSVGAIFPYNDHRLQIKSLCFVYTPNGLLLTDSGYQESISERLLEYFHDLQNLYFTLTGEELTIKP